MYRPVTHYRWEIVISSPISQKGCCHCPYLPSRLLQT